MTSDTTDNSNIHNVVPLEITDMDLEELGRLIKEGSKGGRLDCDNGKHITWKITMDVWED